MKKLVYACQKKELHPDIQKVYKQVAISSGAKKFQRETIYYSRWTWSIIVALRIVGFGHYDTMALLGYDSYLFDQQYLTSILGKKKWGNLLDIGAGSGSITKIFEPFVKHIFYLESSYFFRRKLAKMGFLKYDATERYDIILMLNVLDRCGDAQKMIEKHLPHLTNDGYMIISMPFPIDARHGNGIQNIKQKLFSQKKDIAFETGASEFYESYLKRYFHIVSFSRMPYILRNPEMGKITVFDNAVFVCKKK